MPSGGEIIAAAVVVGAIAGTYALARTLDHIDEAIDGVFSENNWGEQAQIPSEMLKASERPE